MSLETDIRASIAITLPDGSARALPMPATGMDVAL